MKRPLTEPQLFMLRTFEGVFPKRLAHTHDLGSIRTWAKLIELGFVTGNRISRKGREALRDYDKWDGDNMQKQFRTPAKDERREEAK